MAKLFYGLLLLSALCLCASALHPARTKIFAVSRDSYVSKNSPGSNFGGLTQTKIGKEQGGERFETVLGFDIDDNYFTGIDPNDFLKRVEIQCHVLTATTHNGQPLKVRAYTVDSFDENTVTYATHGGEDARTSLPLDTVTVSSGTVAGSVSLDVTTAVEEGARHFKLEIVGSGSTPLLVLASRENVVNGGCKLVVFEDALELVAPSTGCSDLTENVGGVDIVYRYCPYTGDDSVVSTCVYSHGAPSESGMWENVPQYIQEECEVYLINLPGNVRSGEVDLSGGKIFPAEAVRVVADFIVQLDLQNVNFVGQDFGSAVVIAVALDLESRGEVSRIESIGLVEGTVEDIFMCDPSTGCFTDGTAPNPNPFIELCYAQNINNCADIILGFNWFYNQSLVIDPVINALAASVGPGASYVPIALPGFIFPNAENVVQLLTVDIQPSALYDTRYCDNQVCAISVATQGEQQWPRTLNTHGTVGGPNSQWFGDLLEEFRTAKSAGGVLAGVPTTIYCVSDTGFKNIVRCTPSSVAYAEGLYSDFRVQRIGGGMGHFLTEDGNGAFAIGEAHRRDLVSRN